MVQVIFAKEHRAIGDIAVDPVTGYTQQAPIIHIHSVKRHVHGNEVSITVKGEMKIASSEIVYARDLKINTIQTMNLTVESAVHKGYSAQKYIHAKGKYDNYASVDVWDMGGIEIVAGLGPDEGSVWLDFAALGE